MSYTSINRWFFLFVVILIGTGCEKSEVVTIESDVSDSQVFLEGRSLGQAPIQLSKSKLQQLGLVLPSSIRENNSLWESWDLDATGIIIQPKQNEPVWRKLFFSIPDNQAGKLLTTETPWGRMAVLRGMNTGGDPAKKTMSYDALCMSAKTEDGLALTISTPATAVKPGETCRVGLICKNDSKQTVACFRPRLKIYCSRFDEPARHYQILEAALPDPWRVFKTDESNTATFDFTAPTANGDYCVFAIATLYKKPAGQEIYEGVYSNGKMLHVQQ
jgi:hypothetical protein